MVPARHGGQDTAELELFFGPDDRRALDLHRGKQRLGGSYQRPGAVERMQESACTRMLGLSTCSTAQGTGCSRSSGSKVSELLVEFLGRQKSRAA